MNDSLEKSNNRFKIIYHYGHKKIKSFDSFQPKEWSLQVLKYARSLKCFLLGDRLVAAMNKRSWRVALFSAFS